MCVCVFECDINRGVEMLLCVAGFCIKLTGNLFVSFQVNLNLSFLYAYESVIYYQVFFFQVRAQYEIEIFLE